jgi:integrase
LYGLKNLHTGAPAKPRSKENLLRAICALFNFARRSKYVSTELALEISDVPAPRAEPAEIAVFTVPEIRAMIEAAHPEEVAPLAIAAFAPVRLAELARLDWKDVRLGERVIVIEARKAKCAQRRLVPVTDNLAAWLLPRMKVSGLVNPEHAREEADAPGDKLGQMFQNIASRAKVRWRRNALRHSCISYRVAVLKDVPQVALESGNSPAMVFSNYRSLVSEAAAADWFNVYPPQPAGNILPLVVGGAA